MYNSSLKAHFFKDELFLKKETQANQPIAYTNNYNYPGGGVIYYLVK